MYDHHATAEEDDSWKSWCSQDEYLDVLILRSKCWFRGESKDMDVEVLCWWFSCGDEWKETLTLR